MSTRDDSKTIIRKSKFTPEEDDTLRTLVQTYGENDWASIAKRMENRNPRQCHDRWIYYISPDVKTEIWSREEEKKLISLVSKLGGKWTQISKKFPGRNDIQVKNKWNIIKRKEWLYSLPMSVEKERELSKNIGNQGDDVITDEFTPFSNIQIFEKDGYEDFDSGFNFYDDHLI